MVLSRRQFVGICAVAGISACTRTGTMSGDANVIAWGQRGLRDGEFTYPRAVGVSGEEVYIGDKSGRIQVFSLDGQFLRKWSMPNHDNGTPTGISFTSSGDVVIPDTHYSRVITFSREGTVLHQWGSYGTSEREFVYPTDVALDSDGTHYFSEYGVDAERLHVFDRGGSFVRQWGRFGEGPGEFNRAMSIQIAEDGLVYVGDTANHRVQCFDKQGGLVRVIGGPGKESGQLTFPHAISCPGDGTLLVCEYGNNRISRFTLDGKYIGGFGGPGRGVGAFAAPRGIRTHAKQWAYVADTENHRVQRIALGEIG